MTDHPSDDLERRLRESRPASTTNDAGVVAALGELVIERPAARRRRHLVFAGAVAVALVGGASIAATTPGVIAWFGSTDNSVTYSKGEETCLEGFRVVSASGSHEDTPSLRAARERLATLDPSTLETSEQLAEIAARAERGEPTPRNPESTARSQAIYELLVEHVESLGLPSSDVALESGGQCGAEER